MKIPRLCNKGEMANFAISGILALIVVAVILYIMFPIFGGISAAVTPANATATWGAPMAGAYGNASNNIASGATLVGIVEIVIAAVVILGVLMIGLVSRTK
jgi:hypothetical protein